MKKVTIKKMSTLIDSLTQNEDMRQELWVAYLMGFPHDLLPELLSSIESFEYIESTFHQQIQSLINSPIPTNYLSNLSSVECIVLCLLMLGCDLSIISRYNGYSEVKVAEIMVALQEGENGIKEKFKP